MTTLTSNTSEPARATDPVATRAEVPSDPNLEPPTLIPLIEENLESPENLQPEERQETKLIPTYHPQVQEHDPVVALLASDDGQEPLLLLEIEEICSPTEQDLPLADTRPEETKDLARHPEEDHDHLMDVIELLMLNAHEISRLTQETPSVNALLPQIVATDLQDRL